MAAFLAGCASLPAEGDAGDSIAAEAEVRRLEEAWTVAFNNRDTPFMERLLAAEYVLVASGRTQEANITRREDWMRVWLGPEQIPYEAKVLHVVVGGDTAVATLEANWRRKSYLTDTWTRRNGNWQLLHRHSANR